jgi:hypothetical protein
LAKPCPFDYVAGVDWQQAIALGIVAVTAALLVRSRLQRGKSKLPCDAGCGCSHAATPPRETVTYRTRKGERPQIIVKSSG